MNPLTSNWRVEVYQRHHVLRSREPHNRISAFDPKPTSGLTIAAIIAQNHPSRRESTDATLNTYLLPLQIGTQSRAHCKITLRECFSYATSCDFSARNLLTSPPAICCSAYVQQSRGTARPYHEHSKQSPLGWGSTPPKVLAPHASYWTAGGGSFGAFVGVSWTVCSTKGLAFDALAVHAVRPTRNVRADAGCVARGPKHV